LALSDLMPGRKSEGKETERNSHLVRTGLKNLLTALAEILFFNDRSDMQKRVASVVFGDPIPKASTTNSVLIGRGIGDDFSF